MTGTEPSEENVRKARQALVWAEDMIKTTGYAAGTNHITIADLAFVATFSTIQATNSFDLSDLPIWTEYFQRMTKQIRNYEEVNGRGAKMFGTFYQTRVKDYVLRKAECNL